MIKINDRTIEVNHFPDKTILIKEDTSQYKKTINLENKNKSNENKSNENKSNENKSNENISIENQENKSEVNPVKITWLFENNEELVELYFLTKHLRNSGFKDIELDMPYIPNARQDRVKKSEDVFTLKYFAEFINDMNFSKVSVLDPHSYVSEALINHIDIMTPQPYVIKVLNKLKEKGNDNIILFFPDEGAMKRYSAMFDLPYVFGIKKRDWSTGKIQGLDISGQTELIKNSTVLIVDDICSKGGTFYYSAKALKEAGAGDIFLYVSHCENTVLQGNILDGALIRKVFTTNSIFTEKNENIELITD